jgi:hypothetical protein
MDLDESGAQPSRTQAQYKPLAPRTPRVAGFAGGDSSSPMSEAIWVWIPGSGVFVVAALFGFRAGTLSRVFTTHAFALLLATTFALVFVFLAPGAGRNDGTTDLLGHWVGILPLEAAAVIYLASSAGLTCGAGARELRRRVTRRSRSQ